MRNGEGDIRPSSPGSAGTEHRICRGQTLNIAQATRFGSDVLATSGHSRGRRRPCSRPSQVSGPERLRALLVSRGTNFTAQAMTYLALAQSVISTRPPDPERNGKLPRRLHSPFDGPFGPHEERLDSPARWIERSASGARSAAPHEAVVPSVVPVSDFEGVHAPVISARVLSTTTSSPAMRPPLHT